MFPFINVDVFFIICLYLPIRELYRLSQVSKDVGNFIFGNNYLWKQIYKRDINILQCDTDNWMEQYMFDIKHSSNVHIFDTYVTRLPIKGIQIGCTNNYTFVLGTDNKIYDEKCNNCFVPHKVESISVGYQNLLFNDISGYTYGIGDNTFHQIGDQASNGISQICYIENVGSGERRCDMKAKSMSTGGTYAAFIDKDDNLWIQGNNSEGQLGYNYCYMNNLGVFRNNVEQVACGLYHTLFITKRGNVYAMGLNIYGQCGVKSTNVKISATHICDSDGKRIKGKFVACNTYHSVIIDKNNNIYTFGNNMYGQLGQLNFENNNVPTLINGLKAKYAACGEHHTVIIDMQDRVYVCGKVEHFNFVGPHGFKIKQICTFVPLHMRAKQVACGNNHTAILGIPY